MKTASGPVPSAEYIAVVWEARAAGANTDQSEQCNQTTRHLLFRRYVVIQHTEWGGGGILLVVQFTLD